MKTIKVKNILSKKEYIYINDNSLTENIISTIIIDKNQTSQLLNKDHRTKTLNDSNIIEYISKITGRKFAFCEKYDLHASFVS